MPLTGIAESHEAEDLARRKRFAWFFLAGVGAVIASSGLAVWLVGDVRTTVDSKLAPQVEELHEQVANLKVTQQEIRDSQNDGRVRGLKLRAVGCRNIELQGGTFEPDDVCLEAEVEPYFRPAGAGL